MSKPAQQERQFKLYSFDAICQMSEDEWQKACSSSTRPNLPSDAKWTLIDGYFELCVN